MSCEVDDGVASCYVDKRKCYVNMAFYVHGSVVLKTGNHRREVYIEKQISGAFWYSSFWK